MINKDDEEKAFKIAMHTELEWQKLKTKINSEKENTELTEKPIKKAIYRWFDWKPLSLGIAYTAVIVMTTIKTVSVPIDVPISRSSNIQITQNSCPSGSILIPTEGNTQQELTNMREKLKSLDIDSYEQKINNTAYLLEISLPKILSKELLDFWSKEKDIDAILKPNCKLKLVFIAFEE